jgi:NAD(P)-dependent dehydrogenase (short-subunit alcohol dehydrogenase family)
MFELAGKTALVTGGAKRIGKAIAAGLASCVGAKRPLCLAHLQNWLLPSLSMLAKLL